MRHPTDEEKAKLWEEARQEHPGDPMMQEIRYVRFLQAEETKDMTGEERIRYYNSRAAEGPGVRRAG